MVSLTTLSHTRTTHLPPLLIFSLNNQLVQSLRSAVTLQCLSYLTRHILYLTDLFTIKLLFFGMLNQTTYALILRRYLSQLILNSSSLTVFLSITSSWKLLLFFIPILLSLISLYCIASWSFDPAAYTSHMSHTRDNMPRNARVTTCA